MFKLEFEGVRVIGLCRKCYYGEDEKGNVKASSKGVRKRQNKRHRVCYKDALEGDVNTATIRGFQMNGGMMCTYKQKKLGLGANYDKRWILEDGIHTEPIEYQIEEEES